MLSKIIANFFLRGYTWALKTQGKLFSILIGGSFSRFGKKSIIMCPLRIYGEERMQIGDRVFIGSNSWLQTVPDGENRSVAISIGNGTSIAGSCHISALRSVVIEDNVLMGRNIQISDHMHKYADVNTPVLSQGLDKIAPVVIRSGAWVGENVVICPGVTIGKNSVIGANSVVNIDIPNFHVAAGSPAQIIKRITLEDQE
jgi:UDP-3-O-[3-hydroxymyristoyl] glucosamine N-acyltransferase